LGRDFQPAAAAAAYFGFGELEEALIHGGGGAANAGGVDPGVIIKNDVAQAKCKLFFSSFNLRSVSGVQTWALPLLAKKARSFLARLRTGTAPHRAIETCLAFCVPAGFHSYANSVRMQLLHLHIVVRCPDVDATIMEMSRLLSSPTVCIHLALAPLSLFLSVQAHGGGWREGEVLILFVCMHAAAAAAGYLAGAGRPPTLEIFPSWPMRHQQQLHSVKAPPPPPNVP
jgi:hypothetical protein